MLPVRLFCARAFFVLPFLQAKPSPRIAAPNVQATALKVKARKTKHY